MVWRRVAPTHVPRVEGGFRDYKVAEAYARRGMERPVNLSGMRTIIIMTPVLAATLVLVTYTSGDILASIFWAVSGALVTAVLVLAYRFARRHNLRL